MQPLHKTRYIKICSSSTIRLQPQTTKRRNIRGLLLAAIMARCFCSLRHYCLRAAMRWLSVGAFSTTTDALAAHDTTFTKRRVKAYKCDFSIKTFTVKDATIMDDPTGAASVGSEIFQKAAVAFDPWHKKIIFQPYGQ